MLDENLGGGVSLQKTIAELPEPLRPAILEGRRAVERDVLLTPVLAALERGNSLQREAVLKAFDGSFFKGRVYARQPEAMLDVGNDREFGFLYEPPLDVLERTFTALLAADLPAEAEAAGPSALQLLQGARADGQPGDPGAAARRACRLRMPAFARRPPVVGRDLPSPAPKTTRGSLASDPVAAGRTRIERESRRRARRDRPQRPSARAARDPGRDPRPAVAPRGCRQAAAAGARDGRVLGCRAAGA